MKRLDEVDVINIVLNKGYTLDDNFIYINNRTPFYVTCKEGHRYKTYIGIIEKDHRCPKCYNKYIRSKSFRIDPKIVIKFVKEKGGVLKKNFSIENSNSKFYIKCKKGHVWKTFWANIQQGYWCPKCGTQHSKKKQRKNKEEVKKFIEDKGGLLDSDWTYKNAYTKFFITCDKGHRWKVKWNTLQQGSWCPYCNSTHNENDFRKVIEKYFNKLFPRKRPKWLKNPDTNFSMELDGYCKELKMAFEYQGEQHYKGGWYSKETVRRDKIKRKICKNKGITLIVVPYYISRTKWKSLIKNGR